MFIGFRTHVFTRFSGEGFLAALASGRTYRQVAEDFDISTRTIQNWKRRIESNTRGGTRRSKISLEALRKDVEMYPDAYQYERAARFNCTQNAIFKRLKKLNISKKKQPSIRKLAA